MNIFNTLKISKDVLSKKLRETCSSSTEFSWLFLSEDLSKKLPCLVAHIDTVFDYVETEFFYNYDIGKVNVKEKKLSKQIFYDKKERVLWSPQGLGADDRAGVFACSTLYEINKSKCHLVLTDLEEPGGIGAKEVVKGFPHFFSNYVNFFIELDRKGSNDMVFYNKESQKFKKYIKTFGFIEKIGSFSDISILCAQTKIPGVNLSIGYFNQHQETEYLNLNYMNNTIKKVQNIINNPWK